jgi:hypothetical protein
MEVVVDIMVVVVEDIRATQFIRIYDIYFFQCNDNISLNKLKSYDKMLTCLYYSFNTQY